MARGPVIGFGIINYDFTNVSTRSFATNFGELVTNQPIIFGKDPTVDFDVTSNLQTYR
jgi:hypothetical protein